MWTQLKAWLGLLPPVEQPVIEPPPPLDLFGRIEYNLGVLHDGQLQTYSVRQAMVTRLTMFSKDPVELSNWIAEAGRIVDTQTYVPEHWKSAVRQEMPFTLDDYMTHIGYVVDAKQWFTFNHSKITRLLEGFYKLDAGDDEYYNRMYTSVLRDVDTILEGMLSACN
jgi:hypothetical protein